MASAELYALNNLSRRPSLSAQSGRRRRITDHDILLFLITLRPASISALKFEATYKKGKSKKGQRIAAVIEGKIMNLSVETKVAIAVATSFVVLIVGAMAQG